MSTHEIESKVRELRQLQALIEEAQQEAKGMPADRWRSPCFPGTGIKTALARILCPKL